MFANEHYDEHSISEYHDRTTRIYRFFADAGEENNILEIVSKRIYRIGGNTETSNWIGN